MNIIKEKDTKRNMKLKIVIKNVKKAATVVDCSKIKKNNSSISKSTQRLELSEIMTIPKEQLNFILPKLPPKKRWFVVYRRMITKIKPAATRISTHFPNSKRNHDYNDHDDYQDDKARVSKTKRLKKGAPPSTNTAPELPIDPCTTHNPNSKRKFDYNDHDNQDDKSRVPKVKRLKKGVPPSINNSPELPDDYKQVILGRLKGKQLAMLIEKSLDARDVKCDKSILTLPSYETIAKNFLKPNELKRLERHTTLKFSLLDPKCLEWWKKSKEELYVPKTNWTEIVKQNGMVIGDKIQLWSFRAKSDDEDEDQIHLALVLIKRNENLGQENDSNSESSTVSNQSEDSEIARHIDIG